MCCFWEQAHEISAVSHEHEKRDILDPFKLVLQDLVDHFWAVNVICGWNWIKAFQEVHGVSRPRCKVELKKRLLEDNCLAIGTSDFLEHFFLNMFSSVFVLVQLWKGRNLSKRIVWEHANLSIRVSLEAAYCATLEESITEGIRECRDKFDIILTQVTDNCDALELL
jgi:hypothetical protein